MPDAVRGPGASRRPGDKAAIFRLQAPPEGLRLGYARVAGQEENGDQTGEPQKKGQSGLELPYGSVTFLRNNAPRETAVTILRSTETLIDRATLLIPTITDAHRTAFGHRLLAWYDAMRRDLPWRQSRDPYRVWVAEVMLQQTRVDQAIDYYERFIRRFPTVSALAGADLDEVLRAWEGLGYYARARHLHAAAREIVTRWGGVPRSYEALRTLPGIGAYTARAVLSIAYGLPFAAVDANVNRILSRVFSVAEPPRGKTIQALADSVLHRARPGTFNQALMDLGATVCRPRSPDCAACPIQEVCTAFAAGAQEAFPVRKAQRRTPHYDIAVGILFDHKGRLLIQQRAPEAMLGGLWEFPGGKCEKGETPEVACRREVQEETGVTVEDCELACRVQQAYSHFRITLYAFRCARWTGTPRSHRGLPLKWVDRSELDQYAFPRANRRVLEILHGD